MGFFSWNCKGCGQSIRSQYSTCKHDAWMKRVVMLTKNGSVQIGEYGGYGDIDGYDVDWDGSAFYHEKCWKEAGKPDFDGESEDANDQGFFVDTDRALCVKCDNSKCEGHKDYQSKKCENCGKEREISDYQECPKCGRCEWCCECPLEELDEEREATSAN